MNWLCRLGFHRWGKWKDSLLVTTYFSGKKSEPFMGQERVCERCGISELRG